MTDLQATSTVPVSALEFPDSPNLPGQQLKRKKKYFENIVI